MVLHKDPAKQKYSLLPVPEGPTAALEYGEQMDLAVRLKARGRRDRQEVRETGKR